jgi:rhamnogalacturonyl hydrolase YesR
MQGNDTIFNASLLGSKLLAYCYKYTGNQAYLDLAKQSVIACCSEQKADGSWAYGLKSVTGWIDSFHTGYNLDGLIAYREISGDNTVDKIIEKGFEFYINNFFNADGSPKYYSTRQYPIDIHCPGQLLVTLSRLHKYGEYKIIANKVMQWTIANMQSPQGYFYYQLKPGISSKISYMRWSNAFMFAAMTFAIKEDVGL